VTVWALAANGLNMEEEAEPSPEQHLGQDSRCGRTSDSQPPMLAFQPQ